MSNVGMRVSTFIPQEKTQITSTATAPLLTEQPKTPEKTEFGKPYEQTAEKVQVKSGTEHTGIIIDASKTKAMTQGDPLGTLPQGGSLKALTVIEIGVARLTDSEHPEMNAEILKPKTQKEQISTSETPTAGQLRASKIVSESGQQMTSSFQNAKASLEKPLTEMFKGHADKISIKIEEEEIQALQNQATRDRSGAPTAKTSEVVTTAKTQVSSTLNSPLPKMSTGLVTNLFSRETGSVKINNMIDTFTANENKLAKMNPQSASKEIKELLGNQLELLGKIKVIIDSKPNWGDKNTAIDKLETAVNARREQVTTKLNEIIKTGATISEKKSNTSSGIEAKAKMDLTPTDWAGPGQLPRSHNAPEINLVGLKGYGEGKAGAQGATFLFETVDGRELIAKKDRSAAESSVKLEFENYALVYEKAGKHPNLANVHGWVDFKAGFQHESGMIMDRIPGMDGRGMQNELKKALKDGIISQSEYWGAIQYVGRTLVAVDEHLAKAGMVHNDLKPENYMVDKRTGDVIVIDLGGASKTGTQTEAITKQYSAPEIRAATEELEEEVDKIKKEGTNTKPTTKVIGTSASDVYTIGSTLAHTVESPTLNHDILAPNQSDGINISPTRTLGSNKETRSKDELRAQSYQAHFDGDYTKFINSAMATNPDERIKLADMRNSNFLNDSLLDDEGARKILKGITSGSLRDEWKARWEASGKTAPEQDYTTSQSAGGKMDKMTKTLVGIQTNPFIAKSAGIVTLAIENIEKAKSLADKVDGVGVDTKTFKNNILKAEKVLCSSLENYLDTPTGATLTGLKKELGKLSSKTDTEGFKEITKLLRNADSLINTAGEISIVDPKKPNNPPITINTEKIEKEVAKIKDKVKELITPEIVKVSKDLGSLDIDTSRLGYLENRLAKTQELVQQAKLVGADTTKLDEFIPKMTARIESLKQ